MTHVLAAAAGELIVLALAVWGVSWLADYDEDSDE